MLLNVNKGQRALIEELWPTWYNGPSQCPDYHSIDHENHATIDSPWVVAESQEHQEDLRQVYIKLDVCKQFAEGTHV